jgi:Ca2+-binding EF-hand superfamily protein
MEPALNLFRKKLAARGARGILGLHRLFQIMDDDQSGKIDSDEFSRVIREYKIGIELSDVQEIFKGFDKDRSGQIRYEEFLDSIKGHMNNYRKGLVDKAFDRLDIDHSGEVDSNDVKELYNPSKHPAVLENRKTEDQVLQEFLETFELHHNLRAGPEKDYKITRKEFEDYYDNISYGIDNDEYFETMINNTWNLRGKAGRQEGWDTVSQKSKRRSECPSISDMLNPADQKEETKSVCGAAHSTKAKELEGSGAEIQRGNASKVKFGNTVNVDLPKYQNIMLERFRTKLISRGPKGVFGLERQFHIFDLDESGDLSRDEFKKAVNDYKLEMDERDLNNLFKMFDKNNDGKISYHEFIVTIIGRMNEFRKNMVLRAFENLDIEEEGAIDFDYVKNNYRASMHPDVRLGKKTEDEEYNEFISTFTAHHNSYGGPEAKITKEEFVKYYTKISAAVESDSHFDIMMTDVWGLGLQSNAQRLPYAGATSKIYQVNSKNIWKFDHHREMLTGKDPRKDEETKYTKSIYEMSVASSSPHKHVKAEYQSEKPKAEVKEYCFMLSLVGLTWRY